MSARNLARMLPLAELVVSRSWGKLAGAILAIGVVLALPAVFGIDSRVVNVSLFVAIYAVLALGLNVVVGYTGLLDLGYATFLATGAVVAAGLLVLVQTDQGLVLPLSPGAVAEGTRPFGFDGAYLGIILVAGLVCALIGVLRGIPTLRLTGDYYAIVTLGLGEIMYLVYLNEAWLTGGAFGVKLDRTTRPVLFGEQLYHDTIVFYGLVMLTLGAVVVLSQRLQASRFGRAWAAIRLDETAARASGIDVARLKLYAFALSGFLGGIGGALFAVWNGTVATKSLDIWQSILILCAVVLGGMGSIAGVLAGSVILFSLREVLREELFGMRVPPEASFLIYGLLLVIIMRFRPQGIWPRSTGDSVKLSPKDEAELKHAKHPTLFVLADPEADDADGAAGAATGAVHG